VFAEVLLKEEISLITNGTENHMVLLDLRTLDVTGNIAERELEKIGIITNKNTIPFDPQPPMITSGIRIGTPSITTRGMRDKEAKAIATLLANILHKISVERELSISQVQAFEKNVEELVSSFPYYNF
jgi:glycine hydroxymethyltransferase